MLLEEFDVDKYEKTLRMEGMEIGRRQGITEGIEQGARALIETSLEFKSTKEETTGRLMEKLQIPHSVAEEYITRYWH